MTMGERTTSLRPAGWYADPEDATRLRKWDGRGWTDSWMQAPAGAAGSAATGSAATARAHPTFSAATPRPGWYPDPADPALSRWWDGGRWTPRVLTGVAFRGRTDLGGGFFVLAWLLVGWFGLYAVFCTAGIAYDLWAWALVGRWKEDPATIELADADRMDSIGSLLMVGSILGPIALGILFVTWLRMAYGSDRVDPAALRHGAGWTIGVWFVPFLNLVRPYSLVRDLWRGLGARVAGSPGAWLVGAWWGTYLAGRLALSIVSVLERSLEAGVTDPLELLESLRPMLLVEVASLVVTVVAAVLAALLVVRVTRALRAGEGSLPVPGTPA